MPSAALWSLGEEIADLGFQPADAVFQVGD